jgi:hypothetical protein
MSIQESINKFLFGILEEIEIPLRNIFVGTVLFAIAIPLFKIGVLILHWCFTEEYWFIQYIDIMSVSVLILSYFTFIIMSLIEYCNDRFDEIRKKREAK